MFIKENIKLAISGLKANKMRSLLTMLGIIIGISSVIAIVSIGDSMTAALNDTLSQLGASNIVCYVTSKDREWTKEPEDSDLISDEDIDKLKSNFKSKINNISVDNRYLNGVMKKVYKSAMVSIIGTNGE